MVEPGHPRFRYVAFRVSGGGAYSESEFLDALDEALHDASCRLIEFNGAQGIVRCFNTDKDRTIAAMNSIRVIGNRGVTVRTLGTSGTIRKARSKYLR